MEGVKFEINDADKTISVPQSWMNEYGEDCLPQPYSDLIKNKNYRIQLNLL